MRMVKVTNIRHPNWEILLKSNMKLNSRFFFFHLNISRRIQGEGTTSVSNFVLLPSSCSTQTWKTAIKLTKGASGGMSPVWIQHVHAHSAPFPHAPSCPLSWQPVLMNPTGLSLIRRCSSPARWQARRQQQQDPEAFPL